MSGLQLCLSLLAFVCIVTQVEFIWIMHLLKEYDKTEKTLGQWVLDLHKKVDDVIYNEKKETEEINKILSDMLNYPIGDNPYQE